MTAEQALRRAAERGLVVELRENDRLKIRGRADVVQELRPVLAAHKAAILEALRRRPVWVAEAIVETQRLLRECRFPSEPAPCQFHVGHAFQDCKRCGAPIAEHYGAQR